MFDRPGREALTTVAIVGSTGSIGTQTIGVVAREPDRYRVTALVAGSDAAALAAQAVELRPRLAVMADQSKLEELRHRLARAGAAEVEAAAGDRALAEAVADADITVNGVVGFAGLTATLACLEAGKRLALANKESLIAAGPVVQQARRTPGAELIPVDSEHAAIHQCLIGASPRGVSRLQLTASGGPFRGRSREELAAVTVDEALNHPTWSMGPKITVDSSTLMNKGLEVIEANELFGRPAGDAGFGIELDDIDVVVHPQSIVHSMVTFSDGSTIAQLSNPDMRLPIAYALAFPERFPRPFGRIDWKQRQRLDFEPPDREAFPCLDLAYEAARLGGTGPAWLSGANEVAVEAFLHKRIGWADIANVIETTMSRHDGRAADSLDAVLNADEQARKYAGRVLDDRC